MLNQLRSVFSKRRSELVSPLRDEEVNSLRYPGQSVQDILKNHITHITENLLAIMVFGTAATQGLILYFRPMSMESYALTMSVISVALLIVLVPTSIIKYRDMERLLEARDGERIVAEHLNQLIADGYTVFHDLPCGFKKNKQMLFNIDHVLVGKKGIFAVETKTMRKVKGERRLKFNGEHILRFDKPLQHDPVKQAVDQAKWLEHELMNVTNKHFDVMPVVTFPGWYVETTARANHVIVLGTPTAKATRSILLNRPVKLTDADVALVKHRIKMHIQDHRP